jgi:RimJ/RimL family protein N-acetyltransferase
MRLYSYITEAQVKGTIVIKKPSECTKDEILDFFEMVDEANEAYISKGDVKKHGFLLGFFYADEGLVAVSAIKKPYRNDAFEYSGAEEDPDDYPYEMGWSYTLPKYQAKGIMYDLNNALLDKVKNHGVFATVRVDNIPSQKGLAKKGFRRVGEAMDYSVFDIYLMVRDAK